ncbi:ASCH domain-containing protein [Vibrio sonorensis]|uniref:ASCH domain-containing protein n=1 Tax=Vibrio sonorensis TaxID=1004316 RepID=UPI0008DADAD3|nr:ASCH domain-containing protein [Vibrio sonorensis]
MKEVPMIFNTDMVKALLDGRKLVTRRPLTIPECWELHDRKLSKITSSHPKKGRWGALIRKGIGTDFPQSNLVAAPCFVGDLIWVRETFAALGHNDYEQVNPNNLSSIHEYRYKASERDSIANCKDHEVRGYKWVPSIHMPKTASRLTLKVTDVRIERVQDITEEQAEKEGMEPARPSSLWYPYRTSFMDVWDDIYSNWNQNPYVWVIEFEVIHKNIRHVALEMESAA